ncbi:MAG TPA: flagellar hook-associated protein FlgL [Gemmataceae bacterium]|nr:flagellar hook-associated protein FlgL [Gemmataceae bacterium]
MNLRISLQSMVNTSVYYEQQQTTALTHLQAEASSGNRILTPDDDPLGSVAVINYNSQDANFNTDLANINTATDTLNVGVSTLQNVNNILTQAKQLAIEGTNSGNDANSLSSLGDQVNALLQQLVTAANTQNNGQYIFGGTKSSTPPFVTDASGNVNYVGGTDRASVPVGSSQAVDTFYTGSEVFQPPSAGSQNAFQVLAGLRDDLLNTQNLSSPDQMQALSNSLGPLSTVSDNVLRVAGQQSASLQNLSGLQSQLQSVQLQTKQLSGNIQSADMASVVTELQAQQNLLQATLDTTAKMFSQSLLDFIK